jgi:hypothetical protein
MNRAFLKPAAGDRRQPAALELSGLPRFEAAAAQTGASEKREPSRGGAEQSTRRNAIGGPPVNRSTASVPSIIANPADLVARALAILAEEDETWRARRGPYLAPRSIR